MKIVVFGADHRVGVWLDDQVLDLAAADSALPSTLAGLIEGGDPAMDRVAAAIELARGGDADRALIPLAQAGLRAPAVHRPRIACAAGNYAEHIAGSARRKGTAATAALSGAVAGATVPSVGQIAESTRERNRPRGFWKDFALPAGPGDAITYPGRCERFDYEGELVVVLGRRALDVPAGHGDEYVWGVTLLNDWSIRGTSTKDSLSFNLGKNFDGGASIGPCIVVGELDPGDVLVQTTVNGELRQSYNSGDMLYSHAEYIEYLSRDFTLLPGDMVSGGSGPGSATDSDGRFLKTGDEVDVSSPAIGVLHNVVVPKRTEV